MNRRIVNIFLIACPLIATGQCPDLESTYQKVKTISGFTEPSRIIREGLLLAKTYQVCPTTIDSVYAKLFHIIGRSYWYSGNLDTALIYTQQAIAINQHVSPLTRRANLANSYYNLGRIYIERNEYQKALIAFDKGILIAQQYPEKWSSGANGYTQKANLNILLGDYEESLLCGEKGYLLARRAGDKAGMITNLIQKGQSFIEMRRFYEAETALHTAHSLARQLKDQGLLAYTISIMGELSVEQGRHADVIKYYRQAFQAYNQANFPYGCAQILTNLGFYYRSELGDYNQALAMYRQALTFVNDDANGRARLLNNIGYVYRLQKDYPKSLLYYQRALLSTSVGFTNARIIANPSPQSIRLISQKEYLLTLMQDKADTWLDYAKATNNRQRLQYALDTYKVADQMIDFMRWEHTGQLSKLYWREKTRGMYERAIETCFQLKNTDQAFRFFEKSRAAMLADKLNELGAKRQLSPQQATEEQRLQQNVSSQQAKLAGIKPADSVAYKTAQQTLDNRQETLDIFRKKLETSNPAYYRYKYDTTVTALADLRSHLKSQKASFVTYFVGDSTLYVLGVTADTAMLYRRPLRSYQQNVQAFMALLGNPDAMNRKANRDQFLTLGNGLYQQLLSPLKLPVGRVIVSPDGSFVPFETLSRKVDVPDYLVNDYAFSYTYSARLLLKKNAVNFTKHNQGGFLGVAPVHFASSLEQVMLPGSEEALKRIAERFHSPELLTHKAATRRAFLMKAADANVIQLFTHATADSIGQEPMLFFADSTLKLSDLGDGTLPNAQLVVLAACKTGIGAVQRGEGVFSLARGFAALGVPSVLMTLWSVQNDATYQLTDLFYKYVDKGLSKDIALQRAKQDWLKTADQTNQMPNFWAGLIVVGDTEPLEQTNYGLWITVSTLLALAGFGAWFWQRKKQQVRPPVSYPHSV